MMNMNLALETAIQQNDAEKAFATAARLLEKEKTRVRRAQKGNLRLTGKEVFAVDLDDTVGSFADDFRKAYAKREGLTLEEVFERFPVQTGSIVANWYNGDAQANWEDYLDLEARGLLYVEQPVRNGAREVLNWLNEHFTVVFLTARPKAYGSVSKRWLKEVVGINFEPVIKHSHHKHLVKGYDVLIDDSIQQVNAVASSTRYRQARPVIFMEQDHTAEAVQVPVARVRNWKGVRLVVERALAGAAAN